MICMEQAGFEASNGSDRSASRPTISRKCENDESQNELSNSDSFHGAGESGLSASSHGWVAVACSNWSRSRSSWRKAIRCSLLDHDGRLVLSRVELGLLERNRLTTVSKGLFVGTEVRRPTKEGNERRQDLNTYLARRTGQLGIDQAEGRLNGSLCKVETDLANDAGTTHSRHGALETSGRRAESAQGASEGALRHGFRHDANTILEAISTLLLQN